MLFQAPRNSDECGVSSYLSSRCFPQGSLLNESGVVSVALLSFTTGRLSTDRDCIDDMTRQRMSGPSSGENLYVFAHRSTLPESAVRLTSRGSGESF